MAPRDRSRSDLAYSTIREEILNLTLKPGEKIDEVSIAEKLGVSRVPVREALQQLGHDQLIEVGAKGGYRVAVISIDGVKDLMETLMFIAQAVPPLLVARIDPEGIIRLEEATSRVEQAINARNGALTAKRNSDLHILEAELTKNRYIFALTKTVYTLAQRLAFISFRGLGGLDDNLHDHYQKVDIQHRDQLHAYQTKDLNTALNISTQHIKLFRQRIMDYLSESVLDDIQLYF